MDSAFAVFRRLTAVVVALLLGFHCLPSFACSAPYTQAQAEQLCQAAAAADGQGATCTARDIGPNGGADLWYEHMQDNNGGYGDWEYCAAPAPPSNPCSSLTNYSGDLVYDPKYPGPMTIKQFVRDPNTGASVECDGVVKYDGPSTMDAYGHLHAHGTETWNSNPGSGNGTAGTSSFQDSSGQDMNPQPGFTQGSSPSICGGGSCYDPNTNQFCGTSGGTQFCLSGSTADSSQGGCTSSGGATLCAGSPQPPLPPAPPGSQITDPSKQVQGSDTYQQQDPSTGAMTSTTVTMYGQQGTKTSNGAPAGSLPANSSGPGAPASSSSTAGDGVSGGGSCTVPPACMGDAVQCAVVQQTYATRCNAELVHKDLAGTSAPPQSGQHQVSEVDGGTVDLGAKAGDLDTGGFGFSSACPFQKISFSLGGQDAVVDLTVICGWQAWMSGLVLALASLKCADILGRR